MTTYFMRFRRNLPSNLTEWVCSLVVLAIGISWLMFPFSFLRADMATFVEIMSPRAWTTTAIMVGMVSCVSIAAHTESPRVAGLVRSVSALARVVLFSAFLGRSFAASDMASLSIGVVLHSGYIILDLRNIQRATSETFNAFRKVTLVAPMVR